MVDGILNSIQPVLQRSLCQLLEVSFTVDVQTSTGSRRSTLLQLLHSLMDLIVQLLYLAQENPQRQPSSGVEQTGGLERPLW